MRKYGTMSVVALSVLTAAMLQGCVAKNCENRRVLVDPSGAGFQSYACGNGIPILDTTRAVEQAKGRSAR